jgi:hypothetical protein
MKSQKSQCMWPILVKSKNRDFFRDWRKLFRAFREFGQTDWNHRKLLVFGSGKVGMGIIQHGLTLGETSVS